MRKQIRLYEHVAKVSRGKRCSCICPDCGAPLIARQGKVVIWNFAHAVPVECTGESALHKAAKQTLVESASNKENLWLWFKD